jgi:hypothetical protein
MWKGDFNEVCMQKNPFPDTIEKGIEINQVENLSADLTNTDNPAQATRVGSVFPFRIQTLIVQVGKVEG